MANLYLVVATCAPVDCSAHIAGGERHPQRSGTMWHYVFPYLQLHSKTQLGPRCVCVYLYLCVYLSVCVCIQCRSGLLVSQPAASQPFPYNMQI